MEDGQNHHPGLDDSEALKKVDAVSHSEGCQNVDDKNHRINTLQIGLKHLVLKFPTKKRS